MSLNNVGEGAMQNIRISEDALLSKTRPNRFERVSCAQFLGFVNQSHYINPNWGKEAFADPESFRPEYGWWILGHNAEHYAYKTYGNVMRHLTEGTAFRNTNIPSGYAYKPWTLKELTEKLDRGEKLVLEGDWS